KAHSDFRWIGNGREIEYDFEIAAVAVINHINPSIDTRLTKPGERRYAQPLGFEKVIGRCRLRIDSHECRVPACARKRQPHAPISDIQHSSPTGKRERVALAARAPA